MAASNDFGVTDEMVSDRVVEWTGTTSTDPDTDTIDRWITGYAGRLCLQLDGRISGGTSADLTEADHGNIYGYSQTVVTDRVAARVLRHIEEGENPFRQATEAVAAYDQWLLDIKEIPGIVLNEVGSEFVPDATGHDTSLSTDQILGEDPINPIWWGN